MGIKKKLVGNERKETLDELRLFLDWLKTKTSPERTLMMLGLYAKVFKQGIDQKYYLHGWEKIKEYYLYKDFLFFLNDKDLLKVYKDEMKFLEEASLKPSVPGYLMGLLATNFLDNLEDRSRDGLKGLKRIKTLDASVTEKLSAKAEKVYLSTKDDQNSTDKKIASDVIEHIIRSPFYSINLKLLLIRSEDPKGRKGLIDLVMKGYEDIPYKSSKRHSLSLVIEKYLFLANQLNLKDDIQNLDKKFLPIRDERIYDIILDGDSSLNKDKLHGQLRKIFDLTYSSSK